MRRFLLALAVVAAVETAAIACSCIAPGSPEESRTLAREAVRNAVAIVEAEALTEYRPGGEGERVRVHHVLWGQAPRELRLARSEFASGASCDLLLERGRRRRLILSPAPDGRFVIQNICSDFLLGDGGYLAVTIEEARRRASLKPSGERG